MTEEDSSRRRYLALVGAVLVALLGAGTGVRDFLVGDEESEPGLDLAVDYSVTADPDEPTPTPDGGPTGDDPDSTVGGDGTTTAAGTPSPSTNDDPRVVSDDDGAGGNDPGDRTTSGPAGELASASIPPVSVTDLAPGDGGAVDLSLRLSGSPARLWVRADASNFAERSVVESERNAGDTGPPGELQEHVRVRLWYDGDGDGTADGDERVVYDGPLSGLGSVEDWTALTDDCVPPGTHTVRFRWDLPVDAPGTVQTDGVAFSLGVAAEAGDCRSTGL